MIEDEKIGSSALGWDSGMLPEHLVGELKGENNKSEIVPNRIARLLDPFDPVLDSETDMSLRDSYRRVNDIVGEKIGFSNKAIKYFKEKKDLSEEERGWLEEEESNLNKNCWYLVMINHRLIFSKIRISSKWTDLDGDQKEEVLAESLVEARKMAGRWDNERSTFGTLIGTYLPVDRIYGRITGNKLSEHGFKKYIVPHAKAEELLASQDLIINSVSNQTLLAEFLGLISEGTLEVNTKDSQFNPYNSFLEYKSFIAKNIRPISFDFNGGQTKFWGKRRRYAEGLIKAVERFESRDIEIDTDEFVQIRNSDSGEVDFINKDMEDIIAGDSPDIEDEVMRREFIEFLKNTLKPDQFKFIDLRFGLSDGNSHTLEELSITYGVSREMIRRREGSIFRKLREPQNRFKISGGVMST